VIRVLIADDQELVRTGFRMILQAEPDLHIVAEARDGQEAVALVGRTRPDVVLLDIRMPVLDGIQATAALAASAHNPKVLILTTFDLDEYVYGALTAGASGFLLKDVKAAVLADAIRTVHAGDALLAPSATRRLIAQFIARQPRPRPSSPAVESLTARERDILALIAKGLSNQEIAAASFIGEGTVKTHVGRIFAKLNVRDRAQAVIAAFDAGLAMPASHQGSEHSKL
jgi:DNA-binding NarL/FixJ family response regulator